MNTANLTCPKQDNALDVKMFCQIHPKRTNFLQLILEQPRLLHPLENILHGNLPRLHVTCGVKLLHVHVDGSAGAFQ